MKHSVVYLDLRSGHQQSDVLVPLAGQQHYSILPVLDLNTIDLGGQQEIFKYLIYSTYNDSLYPL